MPNEQDRDEFLEEIYEPVQPVLEDLRGREFKPWHKPRKHYLRVHQWCALIRALIKELHYTNGSVLRYLGLPGEDFLDIRTLAGVCDRAEVKLRYLGFDVTADLADEYEVNLSKHEISQLEFVDPQSVLVKERVERIATATSTARHHFERMGPFDVINLDLCDSVAGAVGIGSYFDALKQTCDLQLRAGRTQPWLLFLATRAIRSQIDAHSKAQLLGCVRRNIADSLDFEAKLLELLSLAKAQVDGEISDSQLLEHKALVNAFCLGLSKWLLGVAMSAQPRVVVRLLPSYSYRIEVPDPDMLSLAFRFEPLIEARRDGTGLAPDSPDGRAAAVLNESELATALLEGVSGILDVDTMLSSDTSLNEKMIDKCGTVLASARYDKASYVSWANSVHTFGSASHPDRGRLSSK